MEVSSVVEPNGPSTPAPAPARLVLDPAFRVGALNRRLFGSFVEHMGRCVYTGIYEPEHASADESGFRTDVAELVTELGPTILRYPGGNFVSNYHWEDGVGPSSVTSSATSVRKPFSSAEACPGS